MFGISEPMMQVLVEERRRWVQDNLKRRRLLKGLPAPQGPNIWHRLISLVRRIGYNPPPQAAEEPSEDVLYMAEILDLSPEELRRKEAKRLLYARIAKGNALAEIESRDRKFWEERT